MHFRVHGKRDQIRFIPVHAMAQRLIEEYLTLAGHSDDPAAPCFVRSQTIARVNSTGRSIRTPSLAPGRAKAVEFQLVAPFAAFRQPLGCLAQHRLK